MISDPKAGCNISHADWCRESEQSFEPRLRRQQVHGVCRLPPLLLHTQLMSAASAEPLILTETSELIAQGAEAVCILVLICVACSSA